MTKLTLTIISFLILIVLSTACNKMIPAGFWENFQKDFLIENKSDQGPRGGHRAMYWKAHKLNTFNSKAILDFASKNGWQLTDSFECKSESLESWKLSDKPIFPLSSTGFEIIPKNDYIYNDFPRWINTDLKIYRFKSGWITIEPGTDDSIEDNGFVIINDKGTEMSVYHLWGE